MKSFLKPFIFYFIFIFSSSTLLASPGQHTVKLLEDSISSDKIDQEGIQEKMLQAKDSYVSTYMHGVKHRPNATLGPCAYLSTFTLSSCLLISVCVLQEFFAVNALRSDDPGDHGHFGEWTDVVLIILANGIMDRIIDMHDTGVYQTGLDIRNELQELKQNHSDLDILELSLESLKFSPNSKIKLSEHERYIDFPRTLRNDQNDLIHFRQDFCKFILNHLQSMDSSYKYSFKRAYEAMSASRLSFLSIMSVIAVVDLLVYSSSGLYIANESIQDAKKGETIYESGHVFEWAVEIVAWIYTLWKYSESSILDGFHLDLDDIHANFMDSILRDIQPDKEQQVRCFLKAFMIKLKQINSKNDLLEYIRDLASQPDEVLSAV